MSGVLFGGQKKNTEFTMKLPINLDAWIQENESSLEPPINNKLIDEGKDFFVMAVGGPNARTDYHVNETEVI